MCTIVHVCPACDGMLMWLHHEAECQKVRTCVSPSGAKMVAIHYERLHLLLLQVWVKIH